jgi:hypothetical protein
VAFGCPNGRLIVLKIAGIKMHLVLDKNDGGEREVLELRDPRRLAQKAMRQ